MANTRRNDMQRDITDVPKSNTTIQQQKLSDLMWAIISLTNN